MAEAGKLDNFEKEVVKSKSSSSSGSSSSSSSGGSSDFFTGLLFGAVLFLGDQSFERISPKEQSDESNSLSFVTPRRSGESLLPFARLDFAYQAPDSTIDVFDYRAEVGYAQYGLSFQRSYFYENNAGQDTDKMWLTQVDFLYRMSFGSNVEIDFSIGSYETRGNTTIDSVSVGFPTKVQFNEHLSFEFRPTWADGISDYEMSIYAGWDYAKFKVGYRWLSVGNAELNSPFAGVSFHY